MYMEIWKRFLMARNELFKAENEMFNTVNELFMKAVHSVRDLMNEDNSSLIFFSELEKSITKKASGQEQQHTAMKENELCRKNQQQENSKYPLKEKFRRRDPFRKRIFFISRDGKYHRTEKHYIGKVSWCSG